MNYFTIEKLTKAYDRHHPVLSDLSLSMSKGEVITLLGASGEGKSTLLQVISGLQRTDQGKILLDNKVLCDDKTHLEAHKRGVGMVFQDYALFPHMSVAQNVAYGLAKSDERRMKVKEALSSVSMMSYMKRYPHELSGGQQQRVAIARTIATQPKLLLLDEPFSNLDAQLTTEVTEMLSEVISLHSITTIIVSHRPQEVSAITDTYYEMKSGKLLMTNV